MSTLRSNCFLNEENLNIKEPRKEQRHESETIIRLTGKELLSDVVFWKFDERWRILLNLFNLQQAHMGQAVRRESEYDSRRQDARLPTEPFSARFFSGKFAATQSRSP